MWTFFLVDKNQTLLNLSIVNAWNILNKGECENMLCENMKANPASQGEKRSKGKERDTPLV